MGRKKKNTSITKSFRYLVNHLTIGLLIHVSLQIPDHLQPTWQETRGARQETRGARHETKAGRGMDVSLITRTKKLGSEL